MMQIAVLPFRPQAVIFDMEASACSVTAWLHRRVVSCC